MNVGLSFCHWTQTPIMRSSARLDLLPYFEILARVKAPRQASCCICNKWLGSCVLTLHDIWLLIKSNVN